MMVMMNWWMQPYDEDIATYHDTMKSSQAQVHFDTKMQKAADMEDVFIAKRNMNSDH